MIDHEHGTAARYDHGTSTEPPCREDCCRDAKNASRRKRSRLIAYGRSTMTDAGPAREHVAALHAAGLGLARIARLAGVSARSVRVLVGTEKGLTPSRTVRVTTAEKLLAVSPTLDDLAPSSPVNPAGSRRRLQALVVAGHPLTVLADELGTSYSVVHDIVHGKRTIVRAATAREVRDLADRLWLQPPPRVTHGDRCRLRAAHALAQRFGWLPLAAWDEDEINDPAAKPRVTAEKIAARRAQEAAKAAETSRRAS